jgi:methylglutaconyl-CoA hydratase
MAVTKQMVREVADLALAEAGPRSAERLAALRVSEEAQEGMSAFLERRDPAWWPS